MVTDVMTVYLYLISSQRMNEHFEQEEDTFVNTCLHDRSLQEE